MSDRLETEINSNAKPLPQMIARNIPENQNQDQVDAQQPEWVKILFDEIKQLKTDMAIIKDSQKKIHEKIINNN